MHAEVHARSRVHAATPVLRTPPAAISTTLPHDAPPPAAHGHAPAHQRTSLPSQPRAPPAPASETLGAASPERLAAAAYSCAVQKSAVPCIRPPRCQATTPHEHANSLSPPLRPDETQSQRKKEHGPRERGREFGMVFCRGLQRPRLTAAEQRPGGCRC